MRSIWDLANPQLKNLKAYEPGKPIEQTARELQVAPESIVKLASNENPLGPSPTALAAIREGAAEAHLYPDGSGFYLTEARAGRLQVRPENIVLGNGSNEVIEFLAHAFLNPGDNIVVSEFGFIAYKIIATLFGAQTIEAPSSAYGHDLEAMLDRITPQTRLVIVANPNNPTGTLVSQEQIDRFMDRVPDRVVTVFDEAYFEYLDHAPDTLRYVRAGRNVVVLRTFSKIHGLAGLRVGYGVASAAMIQILQKTREPFNVNRLAQKAAVAALKDQEHQTRTKSVTDSGRTQLTSDLEQFGLVVVPSVANFVMVRVGDGPETFRQLLARKVIVRPLVGYGLSEWVRISIGTTEQNQQCISRLKDVLSNTSQS